MIDTLKLMRFLAVIHSSYGGGNLNNHTSNMDIKEETHFTQTFTIYSTFCNHYTYITKEYAINQFRV